MNTSTTEARYITPPDFARQLGVAPETVITWIRSGELVAVNVAAPGTRRPRYRISPEAIEAWERSRQVVPPPRRQRRRKVSRTYY